MPTRAPPDNPTAKDRLFERAAREVARRAVGESASARLVRTSMQKVLTLAELRRYAIARSLFPPTTLERAIRRLGFVQADPIRAPARAQDLTLRLRVKGYRAGDLERRYEELGIEEDFFINYGFLAPEFHALMHPRSGFESFAEVRAQQARDLLAFVEARGAVHPREADRHLGAGTETNYWGGASNTTTRLLDRLHYRGQLRVVRREQGIRIYAPAVAERLGAAERDPQAALDGLVDLVVRKYAPLPAPSFRAVVRRLRYGAPQWTSELKGALARAQQRLCRAKVGELEWYWPAEDGELPGRQHEAADHGDEVRLLAPFDPVVWDRRRFELFWNWAYRFEAYTPSAARKLGYYALPLLWREQVIGWGNLQLEATGALSATFGYVTGKAPRARAFQRELEAELARMKLFLTPRRGRLPSALARKGA